MQKTSSRKRSERELPHLQAVYEARRWGTLELSNRLRVLELTADPEQIDGFCGPRLAPQAPGSKGCAKFQRCDLHPKDLKDRSISEIKRTDPDALRYLKEIGCLRALMAERGYQARLREGGLTLGDYIGAMPDPVETECGDLRGSAPGPEGRYGWVPRCPYFGCVVPELARPRRASAGGPLFQALCPFAYVRDARDRTIRPNVYRYVACKVSRRSFRDFQRALKVVVISPIAILPGRSIQPEVFYFGKHWAASYQYLVWNPDGESSQPRGSSGDSRLPQEQARLHAPRLVRHSVPSAEESALDQLGASQTIRSLTLLNEPEELSNFENSVGVRYIPAGEFLFLCLMWYWTGERFGTRRGSSRFSLLEDRGVRPARHSAEGWPKTCADLLRARDVWLEDADIDLFAGATCLLHQLKELGLDDDLRGLFGLRITPEGRPHPDADALRADANGRRFIRRSCRLEDLVQLGLLDAETGLTFSPRAGSLTDWLARAVGVLAGGEPVGELSPLQLKRCRKLLRADRDRPKRLDLLRSLSARLSHAHQYGRVAEWLIALNELLNQFGRGRARAAYRKHLRDRGFPVYPLVHLTLLSGLKAPLDWYAIPFSGTLRLASQSAKPKAGSPFRPHGASLVLATARSPSEARDLVTKLQPVLLPTLIPQLGQWTEEVVAKSAQVAAFSSIIAARKHYFKRMADWFELYTNPDDRETQIRSRLKDAKEVRRLGELMGEMLSAARLADKDYDEIGSLAASGYKWALDDVKLWDFYSAAKEIVMPLAQMRQRDIDDAQVRDCGLRVRVPRHAAFHLVLELLRNAVVHDLPGASTRKPGPILVRVAKRGPKIVMSIWNAISTVDDLPRRRFQENKKKYSLRNFADAFQARKMNGLTVVTFLGQLSGCGTSLDNREHPTARERVGVAEIVFPASG